MHGEEVCWGEGYELGISGWTTVVQRSGDACTATAVKSGQVSPDDYSAVLPLLFFCVTSLVGEQECELITASSQGGRVSTRTDY